MQVEGKGVNPDNLTKLIKSIELDITEQDVEEMVKQMTKDQKNFVSFEQFEEVMNEYQQNMALKQAQSMLNQSIMFLPQESQDLLDHNQFNSYMQNVKGSQIK